MEDIQKQPEPQPLPCLKRDLLQAITNNVFMDAVMASIGYTLLEEAFKTSTACKEYPFLYVDFSKLKPEETEEFGVVTRDVLKVPQTLDAVLRDGRYWADRIRTAVEDMLATPGIVAGTMRIQLMTNTETGRINMQLIAVKHTPKGQE